MKTGPQTPLAPKTMNGLTRRGFLAGAGSLLLLGAAGCGGGEETGGESGESGEARVIEHKFGQTEITGAPERVVSVGYTDQDPIIALGVVPVAISSWQNETGIWPWNEEGLEGEKPEVLVAGEPNFEQVAALEPDLIVGVSSGMTRETYDTLSEIAPTIDHTGEYLDFGVPWQDTTQIIGRALDRRERADELIAEVEGQFDEVRGEHPEFEGTSIAVVLPGEEGTYYPYGTQDARARFVQSLGFEIPPEIDELAGDSFYATISEERFDLIDQELLIWLGQSPEQRRAVEESEIYQNLDVVQRGNVLYLSTADEESLVPAFSHGSVLSLPYLLENLVPLISETLGASEETT